MKNPKAQAKRMEKAWAHNLTFVKGFTVPNPLLRWQLPENIPYCEWVDCDQVPIEVLKMRRMPSFRAVLLHKLNVIIMAWGSKRAASRELECGRNTINRWQTSLVYWPKKETMDRIDDTYFLALEKMAMDKIEQPRPGKKFLALQRKLGITNSVDGNGQ